MIDPSIDLHFHYSHLMRIELKLLKDNQHLFTRSEFDRLIRLIGCRYLDNACWVDTHPNRLNQLIQYCRKFGLPTIQNVHEFDSSECHRIRGEKSSDVHIYGLSIIELIILKKKYIKFESFSDDKFLFLNKISTN